MVKHGVIADTALYEMLEAARNEPFCPPASAALSP
jgi:hypothetical protein